MGIGNYVEAHVEETEGNGNDLWSKVGIPCTWKRDWEGGGPNVWETHRLDLIQVWFGIFGMVGGLDQLFQEFILANPLLKEDHRIASACNER